MNCLTTLIIICICFTFIRIFFLRISFLRAFFRICIVLIRLVPVLLLPLFIFTPYRSTPSSPRSSTRSAITASLLSHNSFTLLISAFSSPSLSVSLVSLFSLNASSFSFAISNFNSAFRPPSTKSIYLCLFISPYNLSLSSGVILSLRCAPSNLVIGSLDWRGSTCTLY